MKKLIAIICLFILSVSCNNDRRKLDELRLILSDFSTSGYFVAIDIKCGKDNFPIVVPNNILYLILKDERLVKNQEDYLNLIINTITKNETLLLHVDKEMLESYSVIKNDTLEISLQKNSDDFLRKYFENNRFKSEEFSFDQEYTIIYYLFKNGIYCRRDCISGYVFIDSKIKDN